MRSFLFLAVLALTACNENKPAEQAGGAATPPPAASGGQSASGIGGNVPDVVAKLNGQPVSRDELDGRAAAGVMEATQKLFEAREQALEELIVERLMDAEAAKRGISREELLKAEVESKIAAPTEADVQGFYEQNKARIGAELEMVRDKIVQQLSRMKQGERMRTFIGELKAAAKVETYLEPFRVDVPTRVGAAIKGKAGAPIHIVEWSDFQCPYCTKGAEVAKQVMDKYGDKVSFEYRHFPLGFHPRAHRAAEASECANEQGKFWEFHDAVFADNSKLEDADFAANAEKIGADKAKFEACLTTGKFAKAVDEDMKSGEKVGMNGTPGFYVNGRMISGAQPLEAFVDVIDAELKKKGI